MTDYVSNFTLHFQGFSRPALHADREKIIRRIHLARMRLPKPWNSKEISTIVDHALKCGLQRNVEWLDKNSDEALWASLIYKRGVTLKDKDSQEVIAVGLPLEDSKTNVFYTCDLDSYLESKETTCPLWIVCNDVVDLIPMLNHFKNVSLIDLNETSKTLESVQDFLNFTELAYGHCSEWIIVGGGVVTDTIGLAAFLKGVPISLIPTTLLGMIDAAIGGKTGVNHPIYGKNQIGAFYFPKEVIISTSWFAKSHNKDPLLLKRRDRAQRAGLSEAWKHHLLEGDLGELSSFKVLREMQSYLDEPTSPDSLRFVEKSTRIKLDVVLDDPYETRPGVGRTRLNLGHSFAHIVENLAEKTNKQMDHGEAVAVGILFALSISHAKDWLSTPLYERLYDMTLKLIDRNLESAALLKDFYTNKDHLLELALADKKNTDSGTICEVLLRVNKDKLDAVICNLAPQEWWAAVESFLAKEPLKHL